MLVEIHLEAVDHVLADLGKDAGHRRDEADAQFFRLRARRKRCRTKVRRSTIVA